MLRNFGTRGYLPSYRAAVAMPREEGLAMLRFRRAQRWLDGVVFFRTQSGYPFQVLGCCAPCGLSTAIRGMAPQYWDKGTKVHLPSYRAAVAIARLRYSRGGVSDASLSSRLSRDGVVFKRKKILTLKLTGHTFHFTRLYAPYMILFILKF
jgi:hypothetical protein